MLLMLHAGRVVPPSIGRFRDQLWMTNYEASVFLDEARVRLEPLGAQMAELTDWLPTATRVLVVRVGGILLFTLVLAVVVSIVRRLLLVNEGRTSTAVRISRASIEQPAAKEP